MTVYHSEKELWQDQVRYNKQLISYFTSLHEGKPLNIDSHSRITPEMDYEYDIAELRKVHHTPIAIVDFLDKGIENDSFSPELEVEHHDENSKEIWRDEDYEGE